MSEHISEILQRDLVTSSKRGDFSTPKEITKHVNILLDSAYSTRRISVELQDLGWQQCGNSRTKRNGKTCGYYFKKQPNSKSTPSTKKPTLNLNLNQKRRPVKMNHWRQSTGVSNSHVPTRKEHLRRLVGLKLRPQDIDPNTCACSLQGKEKNISCWLMQ